MVSASPSVFAPVRASRAEHFLRSQGLKTLSYYLEPDYPWGPRLSTLAPVPPQSLQPSCHLHKLTLGGTTSPALNHALLASSSSTLLSLTLRCQPASLHLPAVSSLPLVASQLTSLVNYGSGGVTECDSFLAAFRPGTGKGLNLTLVIVGRNIDPACLSVMTERIHGDG